MNKEDYYKLRDELKALGISENEVKRNGILTDLAREYHSSGLTAVEYLNFRNLRRIRKNIVFFAWILIIQIVVGIILSFFLL